MTRLRHLIELIKFPPYQLGKAELVMAKIDSHHQTSKMGNVKKETFSQSSAVLYTQCYGIKKKTVVAECM